LTEGEIGVFVCVFSLFNKGGSVCVCMCVYTHTCTCEVLGCDPRGRDETPGGPEESTWTESRHICIRICEQITHVYVYARRRDEIWNSMLFFFNIFFRSIKKSKTCERKPAIMI